MKHITIVLAEDHESVREGLRLLIDAQSDMTVVGEAHDGAVAIERVRALTPAVIVMDLNMPNINGLLATRMVLSAAPTTGVVVLTRHNDRAYLKEVVAAGARGYVLKQSPSSILLTAIRTVAAGGSYVDAGVRQDVEAAATGRGGAGPRVTDREREVLRRMALGYSNKEVAAALDISVKTVEVHKANAMRKLSLLGRTDVVRYAALHGWLQDP